MTESHRITESQNSPGWKGPWKINLPWERERELRWELFHYPVGLLRYDSLSIFYILFYFKIEIITTFRKDL